MNSEYIIKAVVVEDEALFLDDLLSRIDECGLPVKVVGSALSAPAGLEIIERERPDVVLSDIRMPGMDGLELMSRVHERFPHIRCVLVSGYMDFAYAKRALTLGVKNYLLKPVDQDELRECLSEIHADITGKLHHMQSSLLSARLSGVKTATAQECFPKDMTFYMLHICSGNECDLLQYRWVSEKYHYQLYMLNFSEMLSALLPGHNIWVINDTEVNKCFVFLDAAQTDESCAELAQKVMRGVSKGSDELSCTVVYGAKPVGLEDITVMALHIRKALKEHIEAWRSNCFPSSIPPREREARFALMPASEALLSSIIETAKPQLLRSQLYTLFMQHCEKYPKQLDIEAYLESISSFLCFRSRLRPKNVESTDYDWLVSKVAVSVSPEECFNNYYMALESILVMDQADSTSTDNVVHQICEYIDQNYKNPINIDGIAKQYYLTTEHLIRTFKKFTGSTPLQYIIGKRIETAKLLLTIKPPLDINQVADMVGYDCAHYFSRIFKNNTGLTPSDYRELAGKE